MADFIKLAKRATNAVMNAYEQTEKDREESFSREIGATIRIQRQARRYFAQKLYQRKRFVCSEVARIFRGHKGRKICKELLEKRTGFERRALFEYQALVIQHVFRGFHSRRYKHDFYARKAYIANILEKSNQLRIQLTANRERAAVEEQERRLREMQEEFKLVAQKLHHLVSTKSVPGVYNSPYALDNKPSAFGIPVEDHLVNCTKELLKEQGFKSSSLPVGARKRIRKSVQATSGYNVVLEAERQESRRSRTMRISNRHFLAGGKGPMTDHGQIDAISKGTKFIDQWRIQKSSRDQALKLSQAPFYSSVKKNKLFDEIADADFEEKNP